MMNLMLYDKFFRVKVYTRPLVKKNGVKSDKRQGRPSYPEFVHF